LRCRISELQDAYHKTSLDQALKYADALGVIPQDKGKANTIWQKILAFARDWVGPEKLTEVTRQVTNFLRDSPRVVEDTALGLAYTLSGSTQDLTIEMKVLTGFLCRTWVTPDTPFRLFLLLTSAVGSGTRFDHVLVEQAKKILLRVSCGQADGLEDLAREFLNNLAKNLSLCDLGEFRLRSIELDPLSHSISWTLLTSVAPIAWNEPQRQQLVKSINQRCEKNSKIRRKLLLTLLNLGAAEQAKHILDMLMKETSDDPDTYCLACTWEARYGKAQRAREHMTVACGLYEQEGKGALPPNIARACLDLAKRSAGLDAKIFKLCSALTHLGPLKPLEEALQVV